MSIIVAAEQFPLTPSIREHVNLATHKAEVLFPRSTSIRVFLSKDADGLFTALFRVHAGRKEIVCQSSEGDLYAAITHAANTLKRKMLDVKQTRIHSRRNLYAAG